MNHHCHSNTMMMDYNLEIAVRDIVEGEGITTEFGLLNIQAPYDIHCHCEGGREHLRLDDIDVYGDTWDSAIKASLLRIPDHPQPLFDLLDYASHSRIDVLLQGKAAYSFICNLK